MMVQVIIVALDVVAKITTPGKSAISVLVSFTQKHDMFYNEKLKDKSTETLQATFFELGEIQGKLREHYDSLVNNTGNLYGDYTPRWIHDTKEEIQQEIGRRVIVESKYGDLKKPLWT